MRVGAPWHLAISAVCNAIRIEYCEQLWMRLVHRQSGKRPCPVVPALLRRPADRLNVMAVRRWWLLHLLLSGSQ